jgi:mannitol/fructose-specific phosphotransferase system IIA component (Ntr-type)
MQAKFGSFAKLFTESSIVLGHQASSKEEALSSFLDELVVKGVLQREHLKEISSALGKRESLGSTGIGNGVAVPHAKLKTLDRAVVALACLPDGVDYAAIDGEPVHILFLLLSPTKEGSTHVGLLKWIATLARSADFRRFLLRSQTPRDVLALIEEMSQEIA